MAFTIGAISSCSDDDDETCDEVPVCTNESATSCCTCADDSCCTYNYDGKEYATADQVANACGASGAERAQIIDNLNASRTKHKSSFNH